MALVLVVGGNAANMQLAVFLLKQAGHETLEAGNAVQGIDVACAHRPDMILIDVQLPDVDGLTVTRVLKGDAATRRTKIVALAARPVDKERELINAAGCDGYIARPICVHHFHTVVGSLLPTNAPACRLKKDVGMLKQDRLAPTLSRMTANADE